MFVKNRLLNNVTDNAFPHIQDSPADLALDGYWYVYFASG